MNGIVRRAIRRRNRFLRIHNKKRTELSWENYRCQRNVTTNLTRQAKQTYYDKVNAELSNSLTNINKMVVYFKKSLQQDIQIKNTNFNRK
jgi:hypothetical protein